MAIDTGSPILNGIINVLLFTLVSYPVLGAFIWLIEVVFYRFFYRYKRTTFKKIPIMRCLLPTMVQPIKPLKF